MPQRFLACLIAALFLTPATHLQAQLQAKQATGKGAVAEVRNGSAAQSSGTPLVHARPALWRIRDKDTTIYLLGTIHLMKPNIVWFEGQVRKAYEQADEVVVEVAEEPDPELQLKILQRAIVPDGPTVTEQLPPELRPAYAEALKELGPTSSILDRVKPWFAALALTTEPLRKLGYDSQAGVDRTIMAEARKDKKVLTGLETAQGQIGLFDALPPALQIALLAETLRERDKIEESIGKMVTAWTQGDPVALAADMNESMDGSPELMKRLLLDRNATWADWLKTRMDKPGVVLMAVGAGHLAGPGSVQEMLAKRGIRAARVKY